MITVKNNEFLPNTQTYSFPRQDFHQCNYRGSNPPGIYRARSVSNPSKYSYLFVNGRQNNFASIVCLNGMGELIVMDQANTSLDRYNWEHCPQLRAEITIIED